MVVPRPGLPNANPASSAITSAVLSAAVTCHGELSGRRAATTACEKCNAYQPGWNPRSDVCWLAPHPIAKLVKNASPRTRSDASTASVLHGDEPRSKLSLAMSSQATSKLDGAR